MVEPVDECLSEKAIDAIRESFSMAEDTHLACNFCSRVYVANQPQFVGQLITAQTVIDLLVCPEASCTMRFYELESIRYRLMKERPSGDVEKITFVDPMDPKHKFFEPMLPAWLTLLKEHMEATEWKDLEFRIFVLADYAIEALCPDCAIRPGVVSGCGQCVRWSFLELQPEGWVTVLMDVEPTVNIFGIRIEECVLRAGDIYY